MSLHTTEQLVQENSDQQMLEQELAKESIPNQVKEAKTDSNWEGNGCKKTRHTYIHSASLEVPKESTVDATSSGLPANCSLAGNSKAIQHVGWPHMCTGTKVPDSNMAQEVQPGNA